MSTPYYGNRFLAEATRDNHNSMPYYTHYSETLVRLPIRWDPSTNEPTGPLFPLPSDLPMNEAPIHHHFDFTLDRSERYDPDVNLEIFERQISPNPPATDNTPMSDTPPAFPRLEADARQPQGYDREEVICVIHRWFTNSWDDKALIVNSTLGWDFTGYKMRTTHTLAKRARRQAWCRVYEEAQFDEIHWWSDLILELTRAGWRSGIELNYRQEDLASNLSTYRTHKSRDHRWTQREKKTLCVLRTSFNQIDADRTRLVMQACFPEMEVSSFGVSERFRRMKRDKDPLWLAMKDLTFREKAKKYSDITNDILTALENLG